MNTKPKVNCGSIETEAKTVSVFEIKNRGWDGGRVPLLRDVADLILSIDKTFLIHPPLVDKNLRLIAGAHRVRAMMLLSKEKEKRVGLLGQWIKKRSVIGTIAELEQLGGMIRSCKKVSRQILVNVANLDSTDSGDRALLKLVELQENEQRTALEKGHVVAAYHMLQKQGYHGSVGRPAKGENAIFPELQMMFHASKRTLQRHLRGISSGSEKVSPVAISDELKYGRAARNALQKLSVAVEEAQGSDFAAILEQVKAFMSCLDEVLATKSHSERGSKTVTVKPHSGDSQKQKLWIRRN